MAEISKPAQFIVWGALAALIAVIACYTIFTMQFGHEIQAHAQPLCELWRLQERAEDGLYGRVNNAFFRCLGRFLAGHGVLLLVLAMRRRPAGVKRLRLSWPPWERS